MARYQPPEQSRFGQLVDIAFLIVAIFVALWLPLRLGLAGAAKNLIPLENPTWEALKQNATMSSIWEKLGYTPETAAAIIQNRYDYWSFSVVELVVMAVVIVGYFVFLFQASDREYREVIRERFEDK
jgi:hypothetical protein